MNDKTFVDRFRTPHTTKLHVVERFRVVDGGKALDISWTADDSGLAYKPWGARRPRYRANGEMNEGHLRGRQRGQVQSRLGSGTSGH
jgi:hypothetical protein